ncbi:adenylosuccinate synthetase [Candidatus Woesearchaeota archaeon]|nr:adenylosuccinate synthetase [Candidatus Woesearchaeota archaeon]
MGEAGKSTVGIGLQYGDEGKGRVTDTLLPGYGAVGQFNGGPNRGHTVNEGNIEVKLHHLPSGIFHKNILLYTGSGCVINPVKLVAEVKEVESKGVSIDGRFFISGNVSLIRPDHLIFDEIYGRDIGSTSNGIGPAYVDRAMRAVGKEIKNIRLGDYLSNPDKFKPIIAMNLEKIIWEHDLDNPESELAKERELIRQLLDVEKVVNKFHENTLAIEKYLCKDPMMITNLVEGGMNIFFEGSQSIGLDCTTGMVPYVTSSNTLAGAAYSGGDLPPEYHHKIIGVAKAIMSRVGHGPFVSEFGVGKSEEYWAEGLGRAHTKEKELAQWNPNELIKSDDPFYIGIALRMLQGDEYGATTKKPRRMGMLDLVMLRQNCKLNGVDELYINKFDCLNLYSRTKLPGIPMVIAYELDGKQIDYMPSSMEELSRVKPVIEYLPFIKKDISEIRKYENISSEAKNAIKFIEEHVGTRIYGIGVGPKREQFIMIK